jgi:hypothetical protein
LVVGREVRILPAGRAVDEHMEVPAQLPALVEEPTLRGRMGALEFAEELTDRAAVDRVLRLSACESLERLTDTHEWHHRIVGEDRPDFRARP